MPVQEQTVQQLLEPFSPPETNFVDRLRYWKSARPDELAFRFLTDGSDSAVELTYAQLDERVRAVAAKLSSLGLRGKRALLMYPAGIDFVIGLFGCHYSGVIPVPAFPPRRNRNMGRINAIADDADASAVLAVREVLDRRDALIGDCETLKDMHWLATEETPLELAGDWVKPDISPDDLAVLQYTSGSTGSPKGVMLTHANVMANCTYILYGFQLSAAVNGISWLPMYHDMGLIGGIMQPAFVGCSSTLMSPVHFLTRPIRWLRAISNYRGDVSGGPNFAYALCCEKIDDSQCEGLDLSSWKVAFNGAEPIRADIIDEFARKFEPYGFRPEAAYPCYGMAETTLLVTGVSRFEKPNIRSFDKDLLAEHTVKPVAPDADSAKKLVACGRTFLDEKVIIVNPDTRKQLGDDRIGEIWIHSASVGQGYLNKEEETEATFQAKLADDPDTPYLRTGDLGFFHSGELYIAGRLKDMIIVRGVNRYPQDIEATVEATSPKLRSGGAAAFAVEHWDRERLIIVSEVERGPNSTWESVIQDIRSNVTAEHDLPPDGIFLVRAGSVPKTSSGKVQRHACRQNYLDDNLLIVEKWISWGESADEQTEATVDSNGQPQAPIDETILSIVSKHVKEVARERAKVITPETNIVVDLGLDSLERLQIANSLEEHFGGRFPDDVLQEIETIEEVASAIVEHIGTTSNGRLIAPVEIVEPVKPKVDIPERAFRFNKMPEFIRFQRLKKLMDSSGIRNPYFSVHEGRVADTTRIDGKELISYSSYNYLGLSGESSVNQMAIDAINQFGTSVSASRIVSGEKTIHKQLESELAEFLGIEDIITFAGGHATNESVIGHLVGPGDMIIHDALAHNSIIQGAELSGARRRPFEHNDWQSLDRILSEIRHEYNRVLIAIEGLYSMDGDFPDLPRFVDVKQRHKAWLFVDEAHSIGTMGETGRGLAEVFGVDRTDVDIWMGTLSKSFGSCGGFIGSSHELVEYLRYTTPGFVFAAGLPPANVGAALGSLRMMIKQPERITRLRENAELFLQLAKEADINTGLSNNSPIIPMIIGSSFHALRLSEGLYNLGINVQPILHPAVEEDKARLRFFITSSHTEEQIRYTIESIQSVWSEVAPKASHL